MLSVTSMELPAVLIQYVDNIITHLGTPKLIYQLNFKTLQPCTHKLILILLKFSALGEGTHCGKNLSKL